MGTRTSLKNSSDVSCASNPSLSSLRPRAKPSTSSVSTTISEVPFAPALGSVLATTMIRLAVWPLVMKVFWPETTYWLPLLLAAVFTPCRSEPAPGSDIAMAPTSSPEAIRGSHFRLCSSDP